MMIPTLGVIFLLTLKQQTPGVVVVPQLRPSWVNRTNPKKHLSATSMYHPKNRRMLEKSKLR